MTYTRPYDIMDARSHVPVSPKLMHVGDGIKVFGTFRGLDASGNPQITISAASGATVGMSIEAKEIAEHEPRALIAGDIVVLTEDRDHAAERRLPDSLLSGRIVHIWNGLAWVDWRAGLRPGIVAVESLERVDDR